MPFWGFYLLFHKLSSFFYFGSGNMNNTWPCASCSDGSLALFIGFFPCGPCSVPLSGLQVLGLHGPPVLMVLPRETTVLYLLAPLLGYNLEVPPRTELGPLCHLGFFSLLQGSGAYSDSFTTSAYHCLIGLMRLILVVHAGGKFGSCYSNLVRSLFVFEF